MIGRRRHGPASVTVAEAAARPPEVVLLDVREDDEWAGGHAPGAVHVPMGRVRADVVPTGRTVYCICRSGQRSGRVARALQGAGIDVRNVTGGMTAWAAAGLPIER